MKIEISNDKSSATIDGIEYELKQKGKKISEWLNELPDGYRELALANFKEQLLPDEDDDIVSSFTDINVINCFNWTKTKEGYDFWYDVFNGMTDSKIDLPPLPKPKFEVWKPKVGDKMWVVDDYGNAFESRFSNICENYPYLIFQTKEKALEAHEKAMFNYEVEMFIKEKNEGWLPDWTNGDQRKCLITFNDGFLDCDFCRTYKATSDCKYFKSKEIGEEIIAKFDNEKLVKYWI